MNGPDFHASFPYGFPSAVGSAITICIALYFIVRGRRRKLVAAVVFFCVCIITWMTSFSLMLFLPDGKITPVLRISYFASWFLIPAFYFNFASVYSRKPRYLFWPILAVSALLALTAEIAGFTGVLKTYFGNCPRLIYPFSLIANAVYFTITNAGMIILYREYVSSTNNDRRYQSFLLWAGTSLGFMFAVSETIMVISQSASSDPLVASAASYVDNIILVMACVAVHVTLLVMVLYQESTGSRALGLVTTTPFLLAAGFPINIGLSYLLVTHGKNVYPFSSFGVLVAVFFIAYAILKYRLIDMTSIFKTILVYILLSAAFLLVYATIIFLVHGRSIEVLPSLVLAVSIIFIFNPMQMILQRALKRLLFSARYNYQKAIREVSGRLVTVLDFNRIIDIIRDTILKTIGARSFALLLYDHERERYFTVATGGSTPASDFTVKPDDPFVSILRLANNEIFRDDLEGDEADSSGEGGYLSVFDRFRATVAIPMAYKGVLSGVLCLGDKESGELYTRQDIELLQVMANQAVIALDNARLYELAITDGLTGLFILKYFSQRLNDEIAGSLRNGRTVSLLMLDIDHFKSVNDQYGHQTGDSVLKNIARIIRDQVRTIDVTARYGGEEFTVILPETDNPTALAVAERIRRAVEEFRFAEDIQRTISIGVATLDGEAVASLLGSDFIDSRVGRNTVCAGLAARLLRQADDALYQAKRGGRNRVTNGGLLEYRNGDSVVPAESKHHPNQSQG